MSRIPQNKIIFFITSVFDNPNSGPATFARILHKYFTRDGLNFKIITSDCDKPDKNIIVISKTRIKSLVYYNLWKAAKKEIKKYPDNDIIIHFNNSFPYLFFGKIGDKCIIQVNDYYTASSGLYQFKLFRPRPFIRHTLRKFTESISIKKADLIVFNSYFTRNFLISTYNIPLLRCEVVYKSVDFEKLNFDHLPEKINDILFIGNNYYIKGLDILIEAIALFEMPIILHIVGPAQLDDQLNKKIEQLPKNIQIILVGALEQENLYSLMRQVKLLVIPARVEALGVSVIEALGMGLPAITSGSGGLKEVLEGYPDICSDENNLNSKHLFNQIMLIFNNYTQYQALFNKERNKIRIKFNAETMVKKLYALYHQ